jgi:hypothetical protein
MQARAALFTRKLALVSVIVSFTTVTALIAQCIERIATPRTADSSECAYILEILNLHETFAWGYRHQIPTRRIPSDGIGSNLKLFGGVLVTSISSSSPLERPESDLYDFNKLCALIVDSAAGNIRDDVPVPHLSEEKETTARNGADQFSNSKYTTETASGQKIEQSSDTVRTNTPAERVLTRVRTKMRCIETILKKAVLESYHINGQIEGLRITGLDKILAAQELLLKSGDIIRVVNGQPLISKKQAYKIFKRARNRPIMEIELLRDGKPQTLLYYLR